MHSEYSHEEILGNASTEAAQKFNEMRNGLKSSSRSIKVLRAQARDFIKKIREAK